MYTVQQVERALKKQNNLVDGLTKLQILANHVGHTEVESWALYERDGYPTDNVPQYRHLRAKRYRNNDRFPVDGTYGIREGVMYIYDNISDFRTTPLTPKASDSVLEVTVMLFIAPTHLVVAEQDLRYLLEKIKAQALIHLGKIARAQATGIIFAEPNFSGYIQDQVFLRNMQDRWKEANKAHQAEAYLSAIILLGSILEGCLLYCLTTQMAKAMSSQKSPKIKEKNGNLSPKAIQDWKLVELINVAYDIGLIRLDLQKFGHALRELRNLVHPQAQIKEGIVPDAGLAEVCWKVTETTLKQLFPEQP